MNYSELNQMNIEDLRSLNKMVVEVIKSKQPWKVTKRNNNFMLVLM